MERMEKKNGEERERGRWHVAFEGARGCRAVRGKGGGRISVASGQEKEGEGALRSGQQCRAAPNRRVRVAALLCDRGGRWGAGNAALRGLQVGPGGNGTVWAATGCGRERESEVVW
jgi:hypothetical protein